MTDPSLLFCSREGSLKELESFTETANTMSRLILHQLSMTDVHQPDPPSPPGQQGEGSLFTTCLSASARTCDGCSSL